MLKTASLLPLLSAVALGCGPSALNLQPASVDARDGAIFGRFAFEADSHEVVRDCEATFLDPTGNVKAILSMDETGWVFAALPVGPTVLSAVQCTVGLNPRVVRMEGFTFTIPGGGKMAYFGHLKVLFRVPREPTISDYLGPGLITSALDAAFGEKVRPSSYRVEDQYGAAVEAYRARYHAAAARLDPVMAMPGDSGEAE